MNPLLCRTISIQHGFKSQFDSLTSEPKPPLLIRKRHLKTNNEGTLSCSLKTYCITVLKAHCIIMCSRVF